MREQNTIMPWHYVEKEYTDYADDIEAVSIHYVWTPIGGQPDWEKQRITRYMPHVKVSIQRPITTAVQPTPPQDVRPKQRPLRKKTLKLPLQIEDHADDTLTNRYLLHYYFEVFQDGHRHYSPLYTEEVVTAPDPPKTGQEGNQEPHTLPRTSPSSSHTKERVK